MWVPSSSGGITANSLCMQMQADVMGIDITRPLIGETTALGPPMQQVLQLDSGHQLMRLENSGNNPDVGALLVLNSNEQLVTPAGRKLLSEP